MLEKKTLRILLSFKLFHLSEEDRQESPAGYGGRNQIGRVDDNKLRSVRVHFVRHSQYGDGRHEACHQREGHRHE